jgi:hypothetical protein
MLIKMEYTYGKFLALSYVCFQTGFLIGSNKLEGETNVINVIDTVSFLSRTNMVKAKTFLGR